MTSRQTPQPVPELSSGNPETDFMEVMDFLADGMLETDGEMGKLDRIRTEIRNIALLAVKAGQLTFRFDKTLQDFRKKRGPMNREEEYEA